MVAYCNANAVMHSRQTRIYTLFVGRNEKHKSRPKLDYTENTKAISATSFSTDATREFNDFCPILLNAVVN